MKKGIISMLCIALAVGTLTGCGSKKEDNRLVIWTNMNVEVDTLQKYADTWGEQNGYEVEVIHQSPSVQQFAQAVKSAEGPDAVVGIPNDQLAKSFAMPGVRLGYLVCSNEGLREKIRRQLPEWNLSVFAQRAGIVCAEQAEQYLQDTVEYVKTKRAYLREGLEALGIRVVSGEADFLLLYTKQPIYDRLLAKGILIRNCENFRGLGESYYRIAVKKQEENEVLLRELAMGD